MNTEYSDNFSGSRNIFDETDPGSDEPYVFHIIHCNEEIDTMTNKHESPVYSDSSNNETSDNDAADILPKLPELIRISLDYIESKVTKTNKRTTPLRQQIRQRSDILNSSSKNRNHSFGPLYTCNKCNQSFWRRNKFIHHLLLHHDNPLETIDSILYEYDNNCFIGGEIISPIESPFSVHPYSIINDTNVNNANQEEDNFSLKNDHDSEQLPTIKHNCKSDVLTTPSQRQDVAGKSLERQLRSCASWEPLQDTSMQDTLLVETSRIKRLLPPLL